MRLLVLGLFLLLALPGFSAAATTSSSVAPIPARVGALAPDATFTTSTGEKVQLSQYRGKVVMLNFWATWCPPCRAEMPSMERLNEILKGEEFVILAVNTEEDGAQVVSEFLKKHPHTFPVLLDPEAISQSSYGVYRLPETFIINKDGTILNHVLGGRDWDDKAIVEYLKFLARG